MCFRIKTGGFIYDKGRHKAAGLKSGHNAGPDLCAVLSDETAMTACSDSPFHSLCSSVLLMV
nr:MAG TPA: hypothetical protein [Caudoviricetes sp.]